MNNLEKKIKRKYKGSLITTETQIVGDYDVSIAVKAALDSSCWQAMLPQGKKIFGLTKKENINVK